MYSATVTDKTTGEAANQDWGAGHNDLKHEEIVYNIMTKLVVLSGPSCFLVV
jgi:hypothetical protein